MYRKQKYRLAKNGIQRKEIRNHHHPSTIFNHQISISHSLLKLISRTMHAEKNKMPHHDLILKPNDTQAKEKRKKKPSPCCFYRSSRRRLKS